jgi:hypothetical protein
MRWLINLWHEWQRAIDLRVLWPICKEEADNIETARAAFAFHTFHDRAWLALGDDEIRRRINELS